MRSRLVYGSDNVCLAHVGVPRLGEHGGAAEIRGADGEPLDVAFDHAETVGKVIERLRGTLSYSAIGLELLPERFTLRQLQDIYEAILGRTFNKDSFRRHITKTKGLVERTGEYQDAVDHRPAELYRRA